MPFSYLNLSYNNTKNFKRKVNILFGLIWYQITTMLINEITIVIEVVFEIYFDFFEW